MTSHPDSESLEWRSKSPHVRKALAWIKKRGGTATADELVEWDRTHGKRLFKWDDTTAADAWRHHQARVFLNSFRKMFEGMRVRGFIHIHKDTEAEINESAYVSIEKITQHTGMREQVIKDITRRVERLTSELRMWRLTPIERAQFFQRLSDALGLEEDAA